jgi:hypothetical protein
MERGVQIDGVDLMQLMFFMVYYFFALIIRALKYDNDQNEKIICTGFRKKLQYLSDKLLNSTAIFLIVDLYAFTRSVHLIQLGIRSKHIGNSLDKFDILIWIGLVLIKGVSCWRLCSFIQNLRRDGHLQQLNQSGSVLYLMCLRHNIDTKVLHQKAEALRKLRTSLTMSSFANSETLEWSQTSMKTKTEINDAENNSRIKFEKF